MFAARNQVPPALAITLEPRWLVVRFARPHAVASWAIVGGGLRRAQAVVWHEVSGAELRPPVQADQLFRERMTERGLDDAVGMLTSRRIERYVTAERQHGEVAVRVVATVGLGNALRAGDAPGDATVAGTINILCRVSAPLAPEAALEALSIAAEARTAAVLEAQVPSLRSGLPATGTGTDCIVVASPDEEPRAAYAGKHTAVGYAIGAAVGEAMALGIAGWLHDRETRQLARAVDQTAEAAP